MEVLTIVTYISRVFNAKNQEMSGPIFKIIEIWDADQRGKSEVEDFVANECQYFQYSYNYMWYLHVSIIHKHCVCPSEICVAAKIGSNNFQHLKNMKRTSGVQKY